jgi:hypothetical protein
MLDSLRHWITKDVPAAVTPAESLLDIVEQGQADREARLAAEEQARQDAARQAKLDALHEAEHDLAQKIARKAELLSTIRVTLTDLWPVLVELDAVEQQGSTLSSTIVGIQIESGQPIGHGWHDAVLPQGSAQVKRWLSRLGG